MQRYGFQKEESAVNIPELNAMFDRLGKSMDLAEISKLMREVYRYSYDNYLIIPICQLSEITATHQKIPK